MRPFSTKATIGASLGLYAATASAELASFTTGSNNDVNFRWGVPQDAVDASSGNVYFQLDAPDSYAWVALGIGSRMENAEIFLMYQDGDGNVTLSTRRGRNHIMPLYEEREAAELLEGSGVEGGRMRANVRCGDCDASLDLAGANKWVASWQAGDSLDSRNPEVTISQHDDMTIFEVDFAQAATRSDDNPFVGNREAVGYDDEDSGVEEEEHKFESLETAHGIVMTIVFVGLYPIGSLLMAVFNKWFLHSASQLIAYILMWVGVGLGATYARANDVFGKKPHTIMGVIVVTSLGVQPILGWLHHRHYAQHRNRGYVGYVHLWVGRIMMFVGIINGGLGLQYAGDGSGPWVYAYSILAGISGIAYIISVFWSRKRRAIAAQGKGKVSNVITEQEVSPGLSYVDYTSPYQSEFSPGMPEQQNNMPLLPFKREPLPEFEREPLPEFEREPLPEFDRGSSEDERRNQHHQQYQ